MGNDIFPGFFHHSFPIGIYACFRFVFNSRLRCVIRPLPAGALDLDDAAVALDVQRVVDIQRVEQFVDLPAAGERG